MRWKQGDSQAAELFERSLALRQAIASSDTGEPLRPDPRGVFHGWLAVVYQQAGMTSRALAHGLAALFHFTTRDRRWTNQTFLPRQAAWAVARLQSAAGKRPDACHAYGRSFHASNAVPAADRFQRLGEEPLPISRGRQPIVATRPRSTGSPQARNVKSPSE